MLGFLMIFLPVYSLIMSTIFMSVDNTDTAKILLAITIALVGISITNFLIYLKIKDLSNEIYEKMVNVSNELKYSFDIKANGINQHTNTAIDLLRTENSIFLNELENLSDRCRNIEKTIDKTITK